MLSDRRRVTRPEIRGPGSCCSYPRSTGLRETMPRRNRYSEGLDSGQLSGRGRFSSLNAHRNERQCPV